MKKEFDLQKLNQVEVKTLVAWAKKEGWNPGPYDAEAFYLADPDGFYGYFEQGELIAGGAIVSYEGEFGFMGLFIVKPAFRGKGIGKKLWFQRRDKLRSRLKKGAAIGMDGVVEMQPFYNKGGFEIAFRDERYERQGSTFTIHPQISQIPDKDTGTIIIYDQKRFGYPRESFLKAWLSIPGNFNFQYKENDRIKGFSVLRKVNNGYKIGPLFADNYAIAEELYKACLNAGMGESVFIDIPLANPDAVQLVEQYDAKYVFECARMYYGKPPQIDILKVFGITSFELG